MLASNLIAIDVMKEEEEGGGYRGRGGWKGFRLPLYLFLHSETAESQLIVCVNIGKAVY